MKTAKMWLAAGPALSTKSQIFQSAGGQDEQINRIDES